VIEANGKKGEVKETTAREEKNLDWVGRLTPSGRGKGETRGGKGGFSATTLGKK